MFFLLAAALCWCSLYTRYLVSLIKTHDRSRRGKQKILKKEGTYWGNRRKRWRNEEEFSRTSRYYVLVNKRSFWWKFSFFSGVKICDCCYRHRRDEMESWRSRETRETHNGAEDGERRSCVIWISDIVAIFRMLTTARSHPSRSSERDLICISIHWWAIGGASSV